MLDCTLCTSADTSSEYTLSPMALSSSTMEIMPILGKIRAHAQAGIEQAVVESSPKDSLKIISYAALWTTVQDVAKTVSALLAARPAELPRHVAYLINPSIPYVVVELAVWLAGGVCVPLSVHSPAVELEYFCTDSESAVVIADGEMASKIQPVAEKLGRRFATIKEVSPLSYELQVAGTLFEAEVQRPEVTSDSGALIIYTSGTTGQPKGVVHTVGSLTSQMSSLSEAWKWSSKDYTLHLLPLHHIHGIMNILNTAIFNGAAVEFTGFDAGFCLKRLGSGDVTCFHAVPTVYVKFSQHLDKLSADDKAAICKSLRHESIRYMVSGSAALPVPTMKSWAEISGHVLLERYGMTEIGMALSNNITGRRYPGCVGWPLPQVEVKLDEDGGILVRGGPVFREYYKREEATKKEFADGWFKTGDNAQFGGDDADLQELQAAARSVEVATGRDMPEGSAEPSELKAIYRIMGRSSVDIIKSGGYKISALEIESVLLQHPSIKECAVVGKPDETWGEKVTAVVILQGELTIKELREWGKDRLAVYKVPQELEVVTELPRNQMGKLEKKKILDRYKQA